MYTLDCNWGNNVDRFYFLLNNIHLAGRVTIGLWQCIRVGGIIRDDCIENGCNVEKAVINNGCNNLQWHK